MAKKLSINLLLIASLAFLGSVGLIIALIMFGQYQILIVPPFFVCLAFCFGCLILLWGDRKLGTTRIRTERARAEIAENYITELQEYVASQDEVNKSLKDAKEKFRHAAFHDVLTQLPNRSLFIETLKYILEKHKQTPNYNFAVVSLDLNRFKTINDSLGHTVGDELVQKVGKRIFEAVREGDLVARFGGDEFGIILSNVTAINEAIDFVKTLRLKISEPFLIGEREVYSSASFGIVLGKKTYNAAEEVLRDADIAMYDAKGSGGYFTVFDDSMHDRAITRMQLETDLRFALERKEFCAFFQPVVSLDTMKMEGFESLIRWNHPTRGLVPPSDFIPLTEDTGLIVPITLWILRHSCEEIVRIQNLSPLNKSLFISVNLSGKHFAEPGLVKEIEKVLSDTKIAPQCLKLEITESAVMENAEMAIPMLKDLKMLGVHLSIDDFGTGYSSLSYLHRFPIDTLKVDRSFVSTMEDGSENGEIVRTIIALAKTLGMDVIAEGIETVHQLHQLRVLKCEYGQGYLFSKPVSIPEVEVLIGNRTIWQNLLPAARIPEIPRNADTQQLLTID